MGQPEASEVATSNAGAGYFFTFNQESYHTSACQIVSAFPKQLLERFYSG